MRQEAPDPTALYSLVAALTYRPGWTFSVGEYPRGQGCSGLTLAVKVRVYDAYNPERGETYERTHFREVPAVVWGENEWARWLLDQCLAVDGHEGREFFAIGGEHRFAPPHGRGVDPYTVPLPTGMLDAG